MAKRNKADWFYAYPDERNRLIEEARELIAALVRLLKYEDVDDDSMRRITKLSRRWLKETKP